MICHWCWKDWWLGNNSLPSSIRRLINNKRKMFPPNFMEELHCILLYYCILLYVIVIVCYCYFMEELHCILLYIIVYYCILLYIIVLLYILQCITIHKHISLQLFLKILGKRQHFTLNPPMVFTNVASNLNMSAYISAQNKIEY